ncbi:mRNA-capping enzyme subunit beta [Entomophthora muscae]|uniref:mRNA-capping enzyme subunit beta n=2 Tax=Entomophthora muscae TaxID=34485 RepID=A0ACC2T1B8_9FUNG|nr:mRNA-capping enzyme subunit beta [Entomophthora muscae]
MSTKRKNSQDLGSESKNLKTSPEVFNMFDHFRMSSWLYLTSCPKTNEKKAPYICELSIFNRQAHDSIVKVVAEFIGRYLDRPNVEIEAKLGLLIDKNTHSRLHLPIMTEAAITQDRFIRFQSDMSQAQHQHFNQMLNTRVNETNSAGYKGKRISYKHLYEKDTFYVAKGGKIRVTCDSRTDEIKEDGIVQKTRLDSMDIYSPLNNLDFRISINDEVPMELPTGKPMHVRIKDRLSYEHDLWRVDLTQVKTQGTGPQSNGNSSGMTHELEIEVSNLEVLRNEHNLMKQGKANQYLHFIHCFLNNVRLLAQYSKKH